MSKVDSKIKTKLSMSRCSGHSDHFRLTIEDAASSTIILEIEIDPMAMADLISARVTKAVPAEYHHDDNIGKQLECFMFPVPLEKLAPIFQSHDCESKERDLKHVYDLAEEMNPGFKADREKYNGRNKIGDTYQVMLGRYLKQK